MTCVRRSRRSCCPPKVPYRPPRRRAGAGGDTHAACSVGFHWAIDASFVQEAWNEPLSPNVGGKHFGEGIRIAHPDTGILPHPELASSIIDAQAAFDFVDDDPDATDPLGSGNPGHGTSTASVIVSDFNATGVAGVSGVAPRAALIPLRVSNSVVHYSWTRLTDAIDHAVAGNAHVVSMSLGGPLPSFVLHDAIADATDAGLILVAAAGNGWPFVVFPARYDEVIAVAASNCADQRWAVVGERQRRRHHGARRIRVARRVHAGRVRPEPQLGDVVRDRAGGGDRGAVARASRPCDARRPLRCVGPCRSCSRNC